MSTRATYQFIGDAYKGKITLYVHHDGYEDGASAYFYAMVKAGGVSPEAFIRANLGAEITGGHDSHADTEFRYTVSTKRDELATVSIQASRCDDKWASRGSLPLADFINAHRRQIEDATDTNASQPLVVTLGSSVITAGAALKRVGEHITEACRCFAFGWIGNAGSSLDMANRLLNALPADMAGVAGWKHQAEQINTRVREAFAVKA